MAEEATAPPTTEAATNGRIARLRRRAVDVRASAEARVDDLRGSSRAVDAAVTIATRPNLTTLTLVSGYIAMRFFVLLFPLAYVTVGGIGLYTSYADSSPSDAIKNAGLGGLVAQSVAAASSQSATSQWLAIIVGLMASAWAGRGALKSLRVAHAMAWRLSTPKTSYASTGGFALAVIALGIVWLFARITNWRSSGVPYWLVLLVLGSVAAAVWLAVSLALPHAPCHPVALVPGALLIGGAAAGLNVAVSVYFAPKLMRASATYGALGAGVSVLTYLLVVAWAIVLAAELNAGIHEWRTRPPFTAAPPTDADGASSPEVPGVAK